MPVLSKRTVALALAGAAVTAQVAFTASADASVGDPFDAQSSLYAPPPQRGAVQQVRDLLRHGRSEAAALVSAEANTPQAVWFSGGTPAQVQAGVRRTALAARANRSIPTYVLYNVPGRDCSQYSSGGAGSDAKYRQWARAVAKGLLAHQRVIVVVEPDGLANLPSDCPAAYPGQDVAALTAGRIADIHYAGAAVQRADDNALVYLDAGHSAWHSVGDIAQRLDEAGVRDFQGFSLNVSNYQPTPQLDEYGTWISKCLYYANNPADGGYRLGHYDYCASQYYPASPTDYSTWHLTDEWYAANVDNASNPPTDPSQLAHFVVDTSRNGQGWWNPPTGVYTDPQDWCNPPGRGLGATPTASTGNPLVDAYLWVKTPGESDGSCSRGAAAGSVDPEWHQVDPAAGAWFPAQALQLAQLASPALLP
jgi:endoglucanase